MSKYFIAKSTGSVLEVSETVMVGQGKYARPLIEQYESRPDDYIPCDKNGRPLSVKTEKVKEEPAKGAKPAAK